MGNKIKVLVVDDSAMVRQTLAELLASDPAITVVGTASDPYVAAKHMESVVPDVITLDVEMPRMDGITFLKKLMTQHPIPVVICSTLTEQGAETTLKALEYGAVDIIQKPKIGTKQFLEESRIRIIDAVKAASRAHVKRARIAPPMDVAPKLSADAVIPAAFFFNVTATTEKKVASHREGRHRRRLYRRYRGLAGLSGIHARRRPRHRHRPAHARAFHGSLRPSP